jgi:cell division protein FtsQ
MVHKRISLFLLGVSVLFFVLFYRKILCQMLTLEVKEIVVYGQERVSNAQLFQALQVKSGDHMWSHSLQQMKIRIEGLPWVKSASIQRRFPGTLSVYLCEKEPVVIWQTQGKKYVVDRQGQIISGVDPKEFSQFIVIAGEKAPHNFAELNQELAHMNPWIPVKAATFLRSQRWDLYLEGGTVIKLPEIQVEKALTFLTKKWTLLKSFRVIDLRFRDALIFQEL